MAFATSGIQKGVNGNRFVINGDWTGAVGDASGTYTVTGKVYDAVFRTQNTASPSQVPNVYWSQNSTTGVTTITIPNRETVTAGTFQVEFVG